MPPRILESGLYFDPPTEHYFRWQDCRYFVDRFKRYGMHEMDFAWWDPQEKVMNLLEFKDYSLPPSDKLPPTLVHEFVQKATDCILLLGSIWHDLPHAAGLKGELSEEWHEKPRDAQSMRLTFVIKLAHRDHRAAMQPLLDKLRNELSGRLELFALREVATVSLLDHWTAQRVGLPVQAPEGDDEPPRRPNGRQELPTAGDHRREDRRKAGRGGGRRR